MKAAIYAWRYKRTTKPNGKPGRVELIAFPAECSKCPRATNAERFGCGWDERYRDKALLQHAWDDSLRTCPRWHLEAIPDVTRVLHDLEDYRRGSLGPVGSLPAPLVDYLRIADGVQRQWADTGEAG